MIEPESLFGKTIRHPEILPIDDEFHLRIASMDDVGPLCRFVAENECHLREFQPGLTQINPVTAPEVVGRSLAYMAQGTAAYYRIMQGPDPEAATMAGTVTLRRHGEHGADLGYWVAQQVEGRGVAYRAARRLLDYARDDWKISSAWLAIQPENIRSERLARRLGAKLTNQTLTQEDRLLRYWLIKPL